MYNIYLYIPDEDKREGIISLCEKLMLSYSYLASADINKSIAEITDIKLPNNKKSNAKAPALYFLPELMLFNAVPDALLDKFFDEYKKAGIPKVKLKAVVTPYNLSWTLYELAEHLKEEAKGDI